MASHIGFETGDANNPNRRKQYRQVTYEEFIAAGKEALRQLQESPVFNGGDGSNAIEALANGRSSQRKRAPPFDRQSRQFRKPPVTGSGKVSTKFQLHFTRRCGSVIAKGR